MRKFKLKSGEVAKLGDLICLSIVITENDIEPLKKLGLIEELEVPEYTIKKVEEHLADRKGWSPENLHKYLQNLSKLNLASVFDILLKEIAIMIDSGYPDHINTCRKVYGVDKATGAIVPLEVKPYTVFDNFAAFRTIEEVRYALKVLEPIGSRIYGKQKD